MIDKGKRVADPYILDADSFTSTLLIVILFLYVQ